jgi:hypothetical protein
MIIDSFVVELGLDPSKFTAGQQKAYDSARKLEEQQLASMKNVEHASDRAGDAISGVKTQALQMLAVFTGGKGILDFSLNLTHANASLGRLERNIGINTATISKWQGVARIFGGDAAQMAQSFTSISDAFAGWKIGMVTPLIADLRAISTAGGKVIDVNKGVEQSYLDLAENLRAINQRDPAQAGLLGRKIGLDPALYDAMITGNLQKVLDLVTKIGVATSQDADAFGELEKRIGMMGLKAESLGRRVLGGDNGVAKHIIDTADFLALTPAEAGAKMSEYLKRRYAERGALGTFWDMLTFQGGQTGISTMLGDNKDRMTSIRQGAFASQAEKEQYIRAAAAKRGINPNVAMAVARSEGFNGFVSSIPGETSYGAFQLHVTPGGRGGHLGDQFQKNTGLDPADPKNERAGIDFALDDVTKNGWKAFHGAKNTGIGQWAGIDRGGGGSNSTTTVQINGPITITPPPGANAEDFASRFSAAVARQSFTQQAAGGQQ